MRLTRNQSLVLMGVAAACAIATEVAFAGTGGGAFDSVWTMLTDWTQGTLGRILAGTLIIVGIAAGILRQSLMGFVVGIAAGVGLYNAPDVINSIFTATLPVL